MLSLRAPSRSPLTRLTARILVLALLLPLVPRDSAAFIVESPSRLTKSAFGELLAHTGSDPQPFAFTGEPYDPNVGFQYHRARWMDPRVGRLLGMDPFAGSAFDAPSLHKYLYAAVNPVSNVDPTGLMSLGELGQVMSFIVTIAAISLPRLTMAVYAVAEILSPVELGLSPGGIGIGQLRKAGKTGGSSALRQLANTWQVWRYRGGHKGHGETFELFIGELLKPGARHHVGIADGVETGLKTGKAVPDWIDEGGQQLVEAKNTFSTVHYEQALEIGHYAANRGIAVHYVFLKKQPHSNSMASPAGSLRCAACAGNGGIPLLAS